jgi:serine O-acetyltransferase
LDIARIGRQGLLAYVAAQLATFFPDAQPGSQPIAPLIEAHLDHALERTKICINAVRAWQPDHFDYLHSTQYCTFLYFLANTIRRHGGDSEICTKLFLLNKALNGIDLFYEIEMPEIFFIGHSVGIVLAKASYGNYLVLYQNSTVGKNHGVAPVIGEGVVMYPNSAIIGRCDVGDGSVVSQGASIINQDVPGHCVVYAGQAGALVFKPPTRDVLDDIFRR